MIVSRAEKTKLLQQLAFTAETDRKLIRDNAVLLHHDKQAVLLSALIDKASKLKDDGYVRLDHATLEKATLGLSSPPNVDKRTREYKEWLKSQPANAQT